MRWLAIVKSDNGLMMCLAD